MLQLEGESTADGWQGPSLQGAHLSGCPQQVHYVRNNVDITLSRLQEPDWTQDFVIDCT